MKVLGDQFLSKYDVATFTKIFTILWPRFHIFIQYIYKGCNIKCYNVLKSPYMGIIEIITKTLSFHNQSLKLKQ